MERDPSLNDTFGVVDDENVTDADHDDEELEDNPSETIIDMMKINHHDNQIDIEGKYVYKATLVKSLFSSNPMSKDRLRRVQGMTKLERNQDDDLRVEDIIMIGDPILMRRNGKLTVAKVSNLVVAGRKTKCVKVDQLNSQNVAVEAQQLKVTESSTHYKWTGELLSQEKLRGKDCFAIKPDIVEEEDGNLTFAFDKQLILDMNVTLTLQQDSVAQSSSSKKSGEAGSSGEKSDMKVACKICSVFRPLSEMRCHVGKHIMKGSQQDVNTCGFCGLNTCSNNLVVKSRSSKNHYKIQSNCEFYVQWRKMPEFSRRSHCSNRMVPCSICQSGVWTYNMKQHFVQSHPDVECPTGSFPTEEEVQRMKMLPEKK